MGEKQGGRLICVMLAASALLAVFAVIAQPNTSLLPGPPAGFGTHGAVDTFAQNSSCVFCEKLLYCV